MPLIRSSWLVPLTLLCATAFAEGQPRVAVLPLATVDAAAPLAPGAQDAFLAAVAARQVELPSTFEVADALAGVTPAACHRDDGCLARVAKATGSGWALSVVALQRADGWALAAQVVSTDGATARVVEPRFVEAGANGPDWAGAFEGVLEAVQLEALGRAVPVAAVEPPAPPPRVTPPPAPVTPAPPAPAVIAQPAPRPRQWRTPVAASLGGLALAAAGAATTLALINVSDAQALRAASHDGVIPADQVGRAAAIDERTAAATGLAVGAGVAAAAAVTLFLTRPSEGPVLVPVASPGGVGASLSWRWP